MNIEQKDHRYIKGLLIERALNIVDRVLKIRTLKTYKDKIISNFRTDDYNTYLLELNMLNMEYKHIYSITKNEGMLFSLLTDTELSAISNLKDW